MDDNIFRSHMNLRHTTDLGGLTELSQKIQSWRFLREWRKFHYEQHHRNGATGYDHDHYGF
jgi:hypothetical protein